MKKLLARQIQQKAPQSILRWLVKLDAKLTLVPLDILPDKYREALSMLVTQRGDREFGDYLEFGVFQGSSMTCMYRAATALGLNKMRFIGFDSFEGLPAQADQEDDSVFHSGEYYCSLPYAQAYLNEKGVDMNRVTLIKGWFDNTCNAATAEENNIKKAAIINIDCDIYSSTKTALEFCKPFIKDDTIIFFDDWNSGDLADKGLGERKAFEEFLEENKQFTAEELKYLSYSKYSTAFYVRVNNIN